LELLVVLVLIGLVAGLAAPRWLAALPGVQLTTGARKTAALLRHAGDRAISEQTLQRVTVDLAANTLELARLEPDIRLLPPAEPGFPEASALPVVLPMPPEILILRAEDGLGQPQVDRLRIFFFPSGGNTGARVTIGNSQGRQLVVHLDFITGEVTINAARET
jgi:type II secretory pathway pseudopilin PulG